MDEKCNNTYNTKTVPFFIPEQMDFIGRWTLSINLKLWNIQH